MNKFSIEQISHSSEVLDRIIDAYGFSSKLKLAEHFGMASSSLAGRYKRGGFPADMVVRCVAETGVNLEWLSTGDGSKYGSGEEINTLKICTNKIVDGQLQKAESLLIDKNIFKQNDLLPQKPACVIDSLATYIIEKEFSEIYDGEWLVEIEGKASIRTLTLIPIQKIRVTSKGITFDCSVDDIKVIGRVILKIARGAGG